MFLLCEVEWSSWITSAANTYGKLNEVFPFLIPVRLFLVPEWPWTPVFIREGAGRGNRTLVCSLGSWCFTG
jgi:hypothetical protein